MTTLAITIGNLSGIKEGDLTHKRSFLNLNHSTRGTWYNRRRF